MSKPWEVRWHVCTADANDVKYSLTLGGESKGLKLGDELWRVPVSIGPISVDHNHWAGHHLDIPAELVPVVAAAPVMLVALEKAAAQFDFYEQQHRAKGTPDSDAKAKVNQEMAAMCRAAVAEAKGD